YLIYVARKAEAFDSNSSYHFSSVSLSMFSVFSNQRALMIPKEQANKMPSIQVKYHIIQAP
ncbi:hypothetical protein AMR44_16655, partial [Shewanella algae]